MTAPNYAVSYVTGTYAITQKALTVTANDKTAVYGAATPMFDATVTGLLEGDDSVTPTCTAGNPPPTDVGTYAITCTLTATNYAVTALPGGTYTITPAALTVKANDKSNVYGATAPTFDATVTGLVGSDSVTPVCSAGSPTPTAAWSYAITCTLTASNYAITALPGTYTITPAALTVKANDKSNVYGAAAPTFDATVNGIVGSDNVTPVCSAGNPTPTAAGSYAINCTLTASNYAVTALPGGTYTITPAALTVKANDKTVVYGSATPTFDATVTGLVGSDSVTTFCSAGTATPTAAGSYTITCVAAAPNYTVAWHLPGTYTITPATLTVTASNKSIVYGAAAPTFDATVTGLVGSDSVTPVCSAGSPTPTAVGTYTIACGVTAPNYAVVYQAGTFTITSAALTSTTTSIGAISPSPSYSGQLVQVTVTVNSVLTGTQPSGTVSFVDETKKDLGSVPVGSCQMVLSYLPGAWRCIFAFPTDTIGFGTHSITASYSGDGNFAASDSAPSVHTVAVATPVTASSTARR